MNGCNKIPTLNKNALEGFNGKQQEREDGPNHRRVSLNVISILLGSGTRFKLEELGFYEITWAMQFSTLDMPSPEW